MLCFSIISIFNQNRLISAKLQNEGVRLMQNENWDNLLVVIFVQLENNA